jgi:hypothetical protein
MDRVFFHLHLHVEDHHKIPRDLCAADKREGVAGVVEQGRIDQGGIPQEAPLGKSWGAESD